MVISWRAMILAIIGLFPILLFPRWSTLGLCVLGLIVVLCADALTAVSPRRVSFSRSAQGSIRLGETTTVQLVVTNQSSRTLRGSVRDGWQPTAQADSPEQPVTIPGQESRRLSMHLTPTRRGTLRSRIVTVRSWGWLGLAGKQYTHRAEGAITVIPPFNSRRHLPSKLVSLREMAGRSAVLTRGAGHEFDSLREYVRGDDVRDIDWRATARAQELVVRTWRPERDRRVLILIDTSRTSAVRSEDGTRLDTGIEAALLLAALADAGGDRVEVIAVDQKVQARASSTRRGKLLHQIVTALTDVFPRLVAADFTQVSSLISQTVKQRALVVLITALDTAAIQQGLLPVLPTIARKHQVVLASVTDPELEAMAAEREDLETVFQAASAEQDEHRRAGLIAQLRRFGAEVVEADPQDLPPRLADTYLHLKAAGRL